MSIRLCLFLTLLLLPIAEIDAQSNWQAAVITKADGEKLVGKIDDRRWGFRIRQLRFMVAGTEEINRYQIADLKAFTVAGRNYQVITASVNTSPRITRELVVQEKRSQETSAKALMLILEGPLSLYEYVDEESNFHFFLKDQRERFRYLEFGKYLLEERGSKVIYQEANDFRPALLQAMADCPQLSTEISKIKYQKGALVNLLKRYYGCLGKRASYELPISEGGWSFGPDVGFVRSSPFYGEIAPNAIFFSRLSSWDPIFGAHLKYRFSGLATDVAIQFGVRYHSFNIQESRPDSKTENPNINSTLEYFYNERSIHFQLGPEAILVRSRYPVVLETAVHYHYLLDYQESRFNQRIINGVASATGLAYDFSNRGAFSLSIGAGVIIGDARLTLWGSATRRSYDTFVLNLYRFGFRGSYDF